MQIHFRCNSISPLRLHEGHVTIFIEDQVPQIASN